MGYSLTNYERETIINYNDAEEMAQVYTCNRALIRRLDVYCQKSALIHRQISDEDSKTYLIPKKYISIRFPKEISREKREKMASMMRERLKEKGGNLFGRQREGNRLGE